MNARKMPPRQPDDGPLSVKRIRDDPGYLQFTHQVGSLVLSEYNAARLFGILAMFLEIPLPAKLGKAIILTEDGQPPPEMSLRSREPKTLGDRLALALLSDEIGEFRKGTDGTPDLPKR